MMSFPWLILHVVWTDQHGCHHSQLHHAWHVWALHRCHLQYNSLPCPWRLWPLHLCILCSRDVSQGHGNGSDWQEGIPYGDVESPWPVHRSFRVTVHLFQSKLGTSSACKGWRNLWNFCIILVQDLDWSIGKPSICYLSVFNSKALKCFAFECHYLYKLLILYKSFCIIISFNAINEWTNAVQHSPCPLQHITLNYKQHPWNNGPLFRHSTSPPPPPPSSPPPFHPSPSLNTSSQTMSFISKLAGFLPLSLTFLQHSIPSLTLQSLFSLGWFHWHCSPWIQSCHLFHIWLTILNLLCLNSFKIKLTEVVHNSLLTSLLGALLLSGTPSQSFLSHPKMGFLDNLWLGAPLRKRHNAHSCNEWINNERLFLAIIMHSAGVILIQNLDFFGHIVQFYISCFIHIHTLWGIKREP